MPVAIADTPGQHALGVDLGAGAALVRRADVDALAAAFSLVGEQSGGARRRQARRLAARGGSLALGAPG